MLRKILVMVAVTAISVLYLNGCKKRSGETKPEEKTLKTVAEYQAEAKEQINKENMAVELENIEKALEEEISREQ